MEASSAESSLPRRPLEVALGPRRAREETADSAGRGDTSEDTDRHGQTDVGRTDGQTDTDTDTDTGRDRHGQTDVSRMDGQTDTDTDTDADRLG